MRRIEQVAFRQVELRAHARRFVLDALESQIRRYRVGHDSDAVGGQAVRRVAVEKILAAGFRFRDDHGRTSRRVAEDVLQFLPDAGICAAGEMRLEPVLHVVCGEREWQPRLDAQPRRDREEHRVGAVSREPRARAVVEPLGVRVQSSAPPAEEQTQRLAREAIADMRTSPRCQAVRRWLGHDVEPRQVEIRDERTSTVGRKQRDDAEPVLALAVGQRVQDHQSILRDAAVFRADTCVDSKVHALVK